MPKWRKDADWIPGYWLRTRWGNWYFLSLNSDRATLQQKGTEHPAPWLASSRFWAFHAYAGAQLFKGHLLQDKRR